MRIGIDIRALMEGKTTGIEVYLVNLLHALFQSDRRNNYFLFANSWREINLPKFLYPNVVVRLSRYPNKFFVLLQKFFGYPKIDKLLGGLDIFFSPHWRTTALSHDVDLVVTFHDLVSEFAPEFFTMRRRLWHAFMDYRSAARRARKIIAVSQNTKKDLVEIYEIAEHKVEVVYPGLPLRRPLPASTQGSKDYFLYFGTFEPRKNIEGVLAAYENYYFQSQTKRSLVIAGSSGWKTKIIIPDGLEGKVTIRQNTSEDEKIYLYQNAFAFVFPSFYEGFGFPVLEAAQLGVPVITSYNSSLSEVSKDFALFVNPFRPAQIAQAMLELEKDLGFYALAGGQSQKAVENFSWEQAAKKTLQLFEELAP